MTKIQCFPFCKALYSLQNTYTFFFFASPKALPDRNFTKNREIRTKQMSEERMGGFPSAFSAPCLVPAIVLTPKIGGLLQGWGLWWKQKVVRNFQVAKQCLVGSRLDREGG